MTPLEIALFAACTVLAALLLAQRRRWLQERNAARQVDEARVQRLRIQAAAEERNRIFNDLHDDLGAKLLQMVYEAENPQQADRARALLQDLRDVVTRSRGTPGTLLEVLSDIRSEAAQRLAASGMALRWEQPESLPDPTLDAERALHLYRIAREAISNALKHARAQRLRVRVAVSGSLFRFEITDDGEFSPGAGAGSGKRSMQARASQLDGDIAWLPGTEGGTKVLLEVPLTADEALR